MLRDQCRWIATGGGEMRGVGAETDAGFREDAANLLGCLGHGCQMWMIMCGQAQPLRNVGDPIERLPEAIIITIAWGRPSASLRPRPRNVSRSASAARFAARSIRQNSSREYPDR